MYPRLDIPHSLELTGKYGRLRHSISCQLLKSLNLNAIYYIGTNCHNGIERKLFSKQIAKRVLPSDSHCGQNEYSLDYCGFLTTYKYYMNSEEF